MIYFVTTFTKLQKSEKGWWEFGSRRTVGYYLNLEDARNTVINNVCDLCETIYHYAIIEGVEEGLYGDLSYQELFKAQNMTFEENGEEYYNSNLTYEPVPLPENFKTTSIAIG